MTDDRNEGHEWETKCNDNDPIVKSLDLNLVLTIGSWRMTEWYFKIWMIVSDQQVDWPKLLHRWLHRMYLSFFYYRRRKRTMKIIIERISPKQWCSKIHRNISYRLDKYQVNMHWYNERWYSTLRYKRQVRQLQLEKNKKRTVICHQTESFDIFQQISSINRPKLSFLLSSFFRSYQLGCKSWLSNVYTYIYDHEGCTTHTLM